MNKELLNAVYFDKIRFILDNKKKIDVSDEELLVILAILMLQEKSELVSVDTISSYLGMDAIKVDDMISLLTTKGYLEIEVVSASVTFNVDNVFLFKPESDESFKDLFVIFEEEFRRPLTQPELVRLNEWMAAYSKENILDSLREASLMNKLNCNYIERILVNQKNE